MVHDETDTLRGHAARYLPRAWAHFFLDFIAISTLGTGRLFGWAKAFSAATRGYSPRYALDKSTISKWLKPIFGDELAEHHQYVQELGRSAGFHFVVAYFPVERVIEATTPLALIIAFERRTETLVHHVVRTLPTSEAVWYVLTHALDAALEKDPAPLLNKIRNTLDAPQNLWQDSVWGDVCDMVNNRIWRNAQSTPEQEEKREAGQKKVEEMRWGRSSFMVYPDTWELRQKAPAIRPNMEVLSHRDADGLQSLLKAAAKSVNSHFRKTPSRLGASAASPSWIALGRSRSTPKNLHERGQCTTADEPRDAR